MIPKVGVPGDVYTVDALLTQMEQALGLRHRIGVEALMETALGMANVEAVAAASPRLEALHFGVAEQARRVLEALDEAAAGGRGAAQLDGRMIDAASARMARNLVETADAITAATG